MRIRRYYKIIVCILLLSLITEIWAQEYGGSWYYNDLLDRWEFKKGALGKPQQIVKWNSLYKRWDIKDSQDNPIGVIEWNPLFKRYDYKLYPNPPSPLPPSSPPSSTTYDDMYGVGPLVPALKTLMQGFMQGYMSRPSYGMSDEEYLREYGRIRGWSEEAIEHNIRTFREAKAKERRELLLITCGVVVGGVILGLVIMPAIFGE